MKNIIILFSVFLIVIVIYFSFFTNKDSETIKNFKKEAEMGSPYAQYLLGGCYYFGKDTKINEKKAFFWFKKSAEQNNSDAQYYLGIMYRKSKVIDTNYELSHKWFKISAEQGDVDSQFELGVIYDLGFGTFKDRKSSLYWYEKSANEGNKNAKEYIELMYNLIGKDSLPDNVEDFNKCKKLAKKGNDNAQYYLGLMYLNGKGVTNDIKKAKYWISESLSNGNIKANEIWGVYDLWKYKDVTD